MSSGIPSLWLTKLSTAMPNLERSVVTIVGGGPVGLLLASELGVRGVPTVVLSDGEGVSTHPKANTHGARSMEIYRRHGLSGRLRAQGLSKCSKTDAAYFTRLRGHELHRVDLPTPEEALAETREPGTRWPTPEPQFRSSQLTLEPLLLERARSFPTTEVRFGSRVTGLEARSDGVSLQVEGDGATSRLDADYVVGCDGGRSFVRRAMGVRYAGEGGLEMDFMGGRMLATCFRAPGLRALMRHPHAWQNWIILPHLRALMLTLDAEEGLYLLHFQLPPEGRPAPTFEAVLEEAVGAPVASEVLSQAPWRAGVSLVAERFQAGRCFLAGDAAHLFTPTGGFGLNTGVDDAFNLGWKLAAVHAGWAAPALLDSYEAERGPVALRNTGYALTLAQRNGACPVGPEIADDTPAGVRARAAASAHYADWARWEYDTPGVQLGVSYRGSPVVIDDGSPAAPDDPVHYVPNSAPGARLPHVWLADGSSLFDRLGPEWTLLSLAEDSGWAAAAARRGVPLEVLQLPQELELRALAGADQVLVRPDQHIAWRGTAGDPDAVLRVVTGRAVPTPAPAAVPIDPARTPAESAA